MTSPTDDQGREDQLIKAALIFVERRIYDGTATAEETVRFFRSSGEL